MHTRVFIVFVFACALLVGCNKDEEKPISQEPVFTIPFFADYDIATLEMSSSFASKGVSRGVQSQLTEVSGLANSYTNSNYLWTHEDSGSDIVIHLLNKANAQIVATYKLKDSQHIDWEDMCIGPGPERGKNYLYIGDIGDNNALRTDAAIYRVEEPLYHTLDSGKVIELNNLVKIEIAYPNGPRDAEALMIDPITKDLLIVSKREDRVELFQLKYPQSETTVDTLKAVGSFPFTGIVAADVSADGTQVLMKSYGGIFHWKKTDEQSIIQLLAGIPQRAYYNPVEPQGEAICWEGNSFYTLSEKAFGIVPKLYFYQGL